MEGEAERFGWPSGDVWCVDLLANKEQEGPPSVPERKVGTAHQQLPAGPCHGGLWHVQGDCPLRIPSGRNEDLIQGQHPADLPCPHFRSTFSTVRPPWAVGLPWAQLPLIPATGFPAGDSIPRCPSQLPVGKSTGKFRILGLCQQRGHLLIHLSLCPLALTVKGKTLLGSLPSCRPIPWPPFLRTVALPSVF